MSENTINKALRMIGYDTKTEVCGHGFRTMACSALNESALWSKDAIERHNGMRAAYVHKAEHLEARMEIVVGLSGHEPRGVRCTVHLCAAA